MNDKPNKITPEMKNPEIVEFFIKTAQKVKADVTIEDYKKYIKWWTEQTERIAFNNLSFAIWVSGLNAKVVSAKVFDYEAKEKK